MASKGIEGLPGYTWLYPGKSNPYGVEVKARTAYNPLTGDMLSVRQAQTQAHQGISYEKRRQQASPPPAQPGQAAPAPAAPVKQYKLREINSTTESVLRDYVKTRREEYGDTRSIDEIRRSSDWKQLLRELRYKSTKPTSKKTQAVRVKLRRGMASAESDLPLGETPDEDEEAA